MNGAIERLIADAVRAAIHDSIAELQRAVAEAVREATHDATAHETPYLTLRQAATLMNVHPKTIRKLINGGKLGRFTVSGKPRVKLGDIHAYMASDAPAPETSSLDDRARRILSGSSSGR